jgi:hypothetical protein
MTWPLSSVEALIERRLLVNFHVRAEVLQHWLPPPFRPRLVNGWGMAGICLIRLRELRPQGLPAGLGMSAENAAHRIAVEWDDRQGVYVPRRDTNSPAVAMIGGHLFPGAHHCARFTVSANDAGIDLALCSSDGLVNVLVRGTVGEGLPPTSVFDSLAHASHFFEVGTVGFSDRRGHEGYEGVELLTADWRVEPLDVEFVRSSFFSDLDRFPQGSVAFDSALLMRNVSSVWNAVPAPERALLTAR